MCRQPRQKNRFSLCRQFIDYLMGVHLIIQRIVHQDDLRLFDSGVGKQTLDDRKGERLQLGSTELSFLHADELPEVFLVHG